LEWSQKNRVDTQFGILENFMDSEHNPVFQSQVLLNGLVAGIGAGYSKKESHQQAAQMALRKIKTDKVFKQTVLDLHYLQIEQTQEIVVAMEI
jgi:ribonuclease-3